MMDTLKLNAALDDLERKMVNEINKSIESVFNIAAKLRFELIGLKKYVVDNDIETSKSELNTKVHQYLKIEPAIELKNQSETDYDYHEHSYQMEKKRKIDGKDEQLMNKEHGMIQCSVDKFNLNRDLAGLSEIVAYSSKCAEKQEKSKNKSNGKLYTFTCKRCDYYFTNESQLQGHNCISNVTHNRNDLVAASLDNNHMPNKNREIDRATDDIMNECKSCNYKTTNLSGFQKHVNTHRFKPFTCNKCYFVGRTERETSIHIKNDKHHTTLRCHKCYYGFKTQFHLEKHLERAHADNYEAMCSLCRQIFNWRHDYNTHYCPALDDELNYLNIYPKMMG